MQYHSDNLELYTSRNYSYVAFMRLQLATALALNVHYLMEFFFIIVCEKNYCKFIALFMCASHWKIEIKVSLTNLYILKKSKRRERRNSKITFDVKSKGIHICTDMKGRLLLTRKHRGFTTRLPTCPALASLLRTRSLRAFLHNVALLLLF